MIDRILEWEPFRRVVAIKNISLESDVLEHHYRGYPLFPGALTLESMAQAAGYLVIRSVWEDRREWHAAALAMVERTQFVRPAFPGDQVRVTVEIPGWHDSAVRVTARAEVGGRTTARGRLVIAHRRVDPAQHPDAESTLADWLRSLERREVWP